MHSMPAVTLHPSSTSFISSLPLPRLLPQSAWSSAERKGLAEQKNTLRLSHSTIKSSSTMRIISVRIGRSDSLDTLWRGMRARLAFRPMEGTLLSCTFVPCPGCYVLIANPDVGGSPLVMATAMWSSGIGRRAGSSRASSAIRRLLLRTNGSSTRQARSSLQVGMV